MSWPLGAEKLGINLPLGFELEEDEDFIFLKDNGMLVATFSAGGVSPKGIENEAWEIFLAK